MADNPHNSPLGSSDKLAKVIDALSEVIDARASADPDSSYTARLLSKGPKKAAQKVAEEGVELAIALVAEDDDSVSNEAADLIYHVLVALRARGVSLESLADTLEKREGTSGLAEKASRSKS
ncbi:MAG: phosphoribosyl-ATP diphosphatase [Pseudomonadota bacterium]